MLHGTVLNPLTQTDSTTTVTGYVLDGGGQPVLGANGWLEPTWNNGVPQVGVGESAFFNLEAVPEPLCIVLLGFGAAGLAACACRRRR